MVKCKKQANLFFAPDKINNSIDKTKYFFSFTPMNYKYKKLSFKNATDISTIRYICIVFLAFICSCTTNKKEMNTENYPINNHSFGNSSEVKIEHIHLNLDVNFDKQQLKGYAKLSINNFSESSKLVLDHKQLTIEKVLDDHNKEIPFQLGAEDKNLGSPLVIDISPETKAVTIYYHTSKNAEAIQWLSPAQTADKENPFLFTQSQAILARTWVPLMDEPSTRFTYSADISCPPHLMALMSASNPESLSKDGKYHFEMPQPIPSYLLALAVGNVTYHKLGENSGVYAEPAMMEKSIYEFQDLDTMIKSAESLYGPYAWGKYDLLVLPASFPFGGMENPRLTFVTPTIITGDRSLVALVAHELAHSWSGNLVTNETWEDFWLNEGFTVYFEQRIMEEIFGVDYANMETENGYRELLEEIETISKENPNDTKLKLDLDGRDPDAGMTSIAYEKGRFLLTLIEHTVGREKWDSFLMQYFKDHAFKTMNTDKFINYINTNLLNSNPEWENIIQMEKWIFEPGLPENCPKISSNLLNEVRLQIATFETTQNPSDIKGDTWSTHQWLYFLRNCNKSKIQKNMSSLDSTFKLTHSTNSEILCDWFKHGIEANYKENNFDEQLSHFLESVGRRKFLEPLYIRLAKHNLTYGKEIFERSKDGYHSVASNTIQEILYKK